MSRSDDGEKRTSPRMEFGGESVSVNPFDDPLFYNGIASVREIHTNVIRKDWRI